MLGNMDWDVGMMAAMGLVWLVVLAGIVVGVVLLIRALSDRGRAGHDRERRAIAFLDERFARGDIDREEYENRRRLLTQSTK